ncbi:MAG: glycosyltransferase [Candidatus Cloacimonetes bacterium]|nr:glycosyltransferase [Candidatus Cloacimonadota bacterium]
MNLLFTVFTALYSLFMLWLDRGVQAIGKESKSKVIPDKHQPISIIIAARNELSNLPRLLKSLNELCYPQECYEIILINDHSDDGSRAYLDTQTIFPKLKVIHFYHDTPPLVGKKAALQQGIDMAANDIFAFTDADCIVPPTWLSEINRSMTEDVDYLLAYSLMKYKPESGIFRLKNFERSVYYALAAAGLYYHIPFTSSACNMVYRKRLFNESGGFDGIGHLLSGDDDLLLMKMMPQLNRGAYNPSVQMQVCSIDGTDVKKHHNTNIRRASKFLLHPWWLKGLSAFVFVYFCLFYRSLWQLLMGKATALPSLSLGLKTATELIFSLRHLKLIGRIKLGVLYPLQILVFPAQFIYYALRGTLGRYRWK